MPNRTFYEDYANIIERQKALADENLHAKFDLEKRKREIQCEGLWAFQKQLIKYMNALRILSSDDISNEKNIDTLMTKFKNAESPDGTSLFDSKDITAYGSLSKLLTNAFTKKYRQNHIKDIIRSAHPDFQTLMKALIGFSSEYIESLETEKSYTANYYETVIKIAESNPPQQAAIVLVRQTKNEKLNEIEKKISNARKYQRIMQKISDSHGFLDTNLDNLASEQILAVIQEHESEILNLYESLSH